MKSKHLKTLHAIFQVPTCANLVFQDMESLVVALGGEIFEREGSRVIFSVAGGLWHAHRPHPGKDAKKYQVEGFREFLRRKGFAP
ncbi:MAG: type II toxin-antitoxin system HicA family toxin [Betaproteobacteria bacterium]|nr:type II toxin-antitoxin system HicA family toxin [Betaproteobacteria bacterium]